MNLNIICEKKNIKINKTQALKLELELNVSEYAKKWIELGDHLYNFHVDKECKNEIIVSQEQFNFINNILKN